MANTLLLFSCVVFLLLCWRLVYEIGKIPVYIYTWDGMEPTTTNPAFGPYDLCCGLHNHTYLDGVELVPSAYNRITAFKTGCYGWVDRLKVDSQGMPVVSPTDELERYRTYGRVEFRMDPPNG